MKSHKWVSNLLQCLTFQKLLFNDDLVNLILIGTSRCKMGGSGYLKPKKIAALS